MLSNWHYRASKISCKSEIQENIITINRFDCAIQHNNSVTGELIYANSMVSDEIALENKGRQLEGTYKSHESRKDGCVQMDTTKDNIRDRSTNTREQVAKMSGVGAGTVVRFNKVMVVTL